MPALGIFQTREAALQFLASSPEFTRIYTTPAGHAKDLDNLGKAQATRYANAMYRYIAQGVDVPNLGWLRGHPVSEGHAGRKAKAAAGEWVRPEKVRLGHEIHRDSRGVGVATYYATRGQRSAEREIIRDAQEAERLKIRSHVVLHVTGPARGDFSRVWEKGGWEAKHILAAIGYKRTKGGRWIRDKQARYSGLEAFVLDFLAEQIRSYGEPWPYISLYEVYTFGETVRETIDPHSRLVS